jgi:hypothetical protein
MVSPANSPPSAPQTGALAGPVARLRSVPSPMIGGLTRPVGSCLRHGGRSFRSPRYEGTSRERESARQAPLIKARAGSLALPDRLREAGSMLRVCSMRLP